MIQKTTNYSQFKYLKGNRALLPYHVNLLANSISERNLLESNPIIVNSKMEVIDGQHRLEAVKKLSLPIYYIIVEGANLTDITLLNTVTRRWDSMDFVNSYAEIGVKDYQILKEFSERTTIAPAISVNLLMGKVGKDRSGELRRAFKTGEFVVLYKEWAEDFVNKLFDIKPFMEGNFSWKSRLFIETMIGFYLQADHEKLMEKLKMYPDKIYVRANILGYLRELEDIYNYKEYNKKVFTVRKRSYNPSNKAVVV